MDRVMIVMATSEIQDRLEQGWIRAGVLRDILTFASGYGMLVAAYAVVRMVARYANLTESLSSHGFLPLAYGHRRNAVAGNMLRIMDEVADRCPDVVIIIALQSSVPTELIASLGHRGAQTIILTPEARTVTPTHGESVYRLRDLARLDDRALTGQREQRTDPTPILVLRESRSAIDRLVRMGCASDRDLALDLLAATDSHRESFVDRLCGDAVDGVLSDVVWGILLMLAEPTVALPDGTRAVNRQCVWDQFIRFGIDIDRIGQQFVIPLLCEEHVLFREDGTCDLICMRSPTDPIIRIAQEFMASVDEFWRTPPIGEKFIDQILTAAEVLPANPARLKPPHVAALIAYIHALQRGAIAGHRFMEADFRRLGVSMKHVRQIARYLTKTCGVAHLPPEAPASGKRLKGPEPKPTVLGSTAA